MNNLLEDKKVAIIATNGFEEIELTAPREALESAGAEVHLISPESGKIKAWDKTDWGEEYDVDRNINDVSSHDYNALLLPGGVLNPDHLRTNEKVVSFVKSFLADKKPIAAICHGPWTLIETGLLKGRKVTSYPSIKTDLKNAGAEWVDEEVVVDNGLVTSRNPDDIPAFNKKMIEEFREGVHETQAH